MIQTGVLRRLLAFTELTFSISMIEAWWRSLKHQWLFLHPLESVATVRRLVAFYVQETTTCFRIRRFEDRRRTRCTSAPGTRSRRTSGHARPPPAKHAWRPTNRRPARRARPSTRPHDRRPNHHSDHAPRALMRLKARLKKRDHVRFPQSRGIEACPGSDAVSRTPAAALNGENSRAKVQNVREDSWADRDKKGTIGDTFGRERKRNLENC
jgi:hypothetical protein